jgi:hypothetical protein
MVGSDDLVMEVLRAIRGDMSRLSDEIQKTLSEIGLINQSSRTTCSE